MQVSCQLSGDEVKQNQTIGLAMIVGAFIICSLFFETMIFRDAMSSIVSKQYDVDTCTVGDYTVRLNLTKEWYDEF